MIAPSSPSSSVDKAGALAVIEAAFEPASERQIEQALTVLSVMVAKSKDDEITSDIALAAYTRKLRDYPADVALYMLRTWPDTNKFWPAWAELKSKLDFWTKHRREMLAAIQHGAA